MESQIRLVNEYFLNGQTFQIHEQKKQELWCLTLVGEENKSPFIRVWKPSPSRRVLKSRGEVRKGKPKEDNIC